MSGIKHDTGKPDLSIIPMAALIEEAEGFMYGEGKYGRYNYCEGFKASRLVAAALRHIYAWNSGADYDEESGVSHLGHARCCLAMLLECERLGTLTDDRYTPAVQPHIVDTLTDEWIADIEADGSESVAYVVVARDNKGEEITLERCADPIYAQHRLDHYRDQWPTFKLSIKEVADNGHT